MARLIGGQEGYHANRVIRKCHTVRGRQLAVSVRGERDSAYGQRSVTRLGSLNLIMVSAFLLVTGCEKPEPAPVDPSQAVKDRAVAVLRDRMKDPASLEIRNLVAVKHGEWDVVCGEYNAKNSLGGYVGFQRFAWRGNGDFAMESEPSTYLGVFWRICRNGGESAASP